MAHRRKIWRGSTARNIDAKSYIHSSQRNVLNRFLRCQGKPDRYQIDYSPLYQRSPDWWIRRRHEEPRPLNVVLFGDAAAGRVDELKNQLTSTTDYPIEHVCWLPEEELIPWLNESAKKADSRKSPAEALVAL